MHSVLQLTITNSTDPEIPNGSYPMIYREGGICGEGQYSAYPQGGVPVWFDVHAGGLCLPIHLEKECRSYPLVELPQRGRVVAKGRVFDWTVDAMKETV